VLLEGDEVAHGRWRQRLQQTHLIETDRIAVKGGHTRLQNFSTPARSGFPVQRSSARSMRSTVGRSTPSARVCADVGV
jgi:hypothetical protein